MNCPSCAALLRENGDRLACDACTGVMLPEPDLERALHEHIGAVSVELQIVDRKRSKRTCPRCATTMRTSYVLAVFAPPYGKRPHTTHTRPELDHCEDHGVWFDANELAVVLEALRHASELPGHATLRDIALTIIENYGRRGEVEPPEIKS